VGERERDEETKRLRDKETNKQMNNTIDNIVRLMSEKYSLDISVYDESFLQKTVINRTNDLLCLTVTDYLQYLENTPSELLILADSLNNSYSEFFRNPLTFLLLEQSVLPRIFFEKENSQITEIRMWSAGCAAGQEAYSLAILADNFRNNHHPSVSLRIFATDRSEKDLKTARKGIYSSKSIQNSRLELVNKYFSNSGEFYSVIENIKRIIDFSIFDLLEKEVHSPPASIYGGFDIIMCSNLLFYYKPEIQSVILSKLAGSLSPGGFLVTGEAETDIIKSSKGFRQYGELKTIFVRL
jgi:chemotaxis methyl-accepting protein methylase